MEQIELLINDYLIYIVLGLGLLVIILMILVCVNAAKMKKSSVGMKCLCLKKILI